MKAELPLESRSRMIVACVARYHGCRLPREGDRVFKDLRPKDRRLVRKLSALLALADALDRGHCSRVSGMDIAVKKKEVRLTLRGRGPFSLEREWSGHKSVQFEKAFDRRVVIDE